MECWWGVGAGRMSAMGEGISAGTEPICERDTQPCQIRGEDGVRVLGWVWVRVLGAGRISAMGEGTSTGTEPICERVFGRVECWKL